MIASVTFRNFKALRNTRLQFAPFNLVIGPNGSGKTSLIQALVRLRDLSKLPVTEIPAHSDRAEALEVAFRFSPPYADVQARLACSHELACDLLQVRAPSPQLWQALLPGLASLRSFVLDHAAIAAGVTGRDPHAGRRLSADGRNVADVLVNRREQQPEAYARTEREFCRLLPEFERLEFPLLPDGSVRLLALLTDGSRVPAENLSQGTLYALALLTLAFDPSPPAVACIEEIDRGIHPRLLREIRDILYRLSYPSAFGETKSPVQIVATTHSPYLLDLFRDHPEEVVIAQKQGAEAHFERLSDRADIHEILQEGTLGDMWFAGILGGVPEEDVRLRPGTPGPHGRRE